MTEILSSPEPWGRYPKKKQRFKSLKWQDEPLPDEASLLAFGMGRSYGDSCLNSNGLLLSTRQLNRFISFDPLSGVLICEPGVTLQQLTKQFLPQGWFPPVSPGTCYVTIGGAVANDVHGKNHHKAGSFGNHVLWFELLRSNGERLRCSANENAEYFYATIGGLGLTGFITKVAVQLLHISSAFMEVENSRFDNLEDFKTLSEESVSDYDYTVAWVDCMAKGGKLGRGIFMRANHADNPHDKSELFIRNNKSLAIPFEFPQFALNTYSISNFNRLYFYKQWQKKQRIKQYYQSYFYPLDTLKRWNLIYGKSGFLQYQFVVPLKNYNALYEAFRMISDSGAGSFLAVLKEFGSIASQGLMSFPREGVCLALDFPNKGKQTFDLLNKLDELIIAAEGALYPAKDARMSAKMFASSFPNMHKFTSFIDPKFQSDFWLRVNNNHTK